MTEIGTAVVGALEGLDTVLITTVLPAAVLVTAVVWGAPKAIGFFKKTAK